MLRGLFVTGTDTGVGKTVVSAALLHRYRGACAPLRYWKPIQTGLPDDDTATVADLGECSPAELLDAGVRLRPPLSPHLAARLSGQSIALPPLLRLLESAPEARRWIVEGAGGALVPINDIDLMRDLMRAVALPVLLVARTTLGTINHSLLTVEALRAVALPIAGVVMVGDPDAENRRAIERYAALPVIGELPWLRPLDPAALRAWARTALDRDGVLESLFR